MLMTKSEFLDAFREAASDEFADAIEAGQNTPHIFSHQFEKRMEKLLQNEKRIAWRLVSTASRRMALALALLLALMTAAASCHASEIIEKARTFLIKVNDTFSYITFKGEKSNEITQEYMLAALPDGYIEKKLYKTHVYISKTYINDAGDKIVLCQSILNDDSTISHDNEKGELIEVSANGRQYCIYSSDYVTSAFWTEDGYVFRIDCLPSVSIDYILYLAKSVGNVN